MPSKRLSRDAFSASNSGLTVGGELVVPAE
jgi:hypothetical protein